GLGTSQLIGSLSGSGSVILDRVGGTLGVSGGANSTFSGVNTYTGGTTVSSGRLVATNPTGDYANRAALEFAIASDRDFTTPVAIGPATPNEISGSGNFTKSGAGTLTMIKPSTYTGGTTISGGRLVDPAPHGDYVNNAALEFRIAEDQGSYSLVSGTGSLTKSGPASLAMYTRQTYTGSTAITEGSIDLAYVDNILPTGTDLTIGSAGTFGFIASSQKVASLSGAGTVSLGDAAFAVDGAASTTFSGTILGDGSFTKAGAGTLTLSGSNTYTGGTAIKGGTLRMGQNNALPTTSKVDVASGATLDVYGNLQSLGALTGAGRVELRDSGRLSVAGNGSTFAGAISGGGSFTKTGSGTFTLSGVSDYTNGTRVLDTGTLRVTGAISGNLNVAPNATFE
ncbi:hypothetical protein EON77_15200, partial [bacterium]